jgi:hypothetical protein
MSVELSLLKLFCDDRFVESQTKVYLASLSNLERELKLLFNLVSNYYKDYEAKSITQEELTTYYSLKYPNAKEREMHLDLIKEAFASKVTMELLRSHIDQLIEKHKATKMVNKLLPVMEGEKYGVLDTLRTDIDDYTALLHNPPDSVVVPVPCELSVEELIAQEIDDGGLRWHLDELTNIIGGCRKKTLGLIYAFVDTGKTSFSMAAVVAFAKQLVGTEDVIAYCGNEAAVMKRVQDVYGSDLCKLSAIGHADRLRNAELRQRKSHKREV